MIQVTAPLSSYLYFMFRCAGTWLQHRVSRHAVPVSRLRRQLRALKAANQAATAELQKRRQLAMLLQRQRVESSQRMNTEKPSGPSSRSSGNHTNSTQQADEDLLHRRTIAYLPRNNELETAIAFTLKENRDARTELQFTRHLISSTLLSIASPVGCWDPYDVKPQVFALDNYLALPVFTSVEYLQLFCERFGITVRDPSGVLWADGGNRRGDVRVPLLMPPSDLTESSWWAKREAVASATTCAEETATQDGATGGVTQATSQSPAAAFATTAEELFGDMEADTVWPPPAAAATVPTGERPDVGKKRRRPQRRRPSSNRRAAAAAGMGGGPRRRRPSAVKMRRADPKRPRLPSLASAPQDTQQTQAKKQAFWAAVAAVSPFSIKQATPLPIFGPFTHAFFPGYFADVNTLLHNAAIVPEKVDIVLNPCSPIEFVLARQATDRVLHKDQLLVLAYQRVEKELQREFGTFFAAYCPEIQYARIACVSRPLDPLPRNSITANSKRKVREPHNPLLAYRAATRLQREAEFSSGAGYDIVIMLASEELEATYRCIQWGKRTCRLMGHADLDIVPEGVAAPHVQDAGHIFYRRPEVPADSHTTQQDRDQLRSCFRRAGVTVTVNVAQAADSYYHDPTNAYTEAHAVFTEELSVKPHSL